MKEHIMEIKRQADVSLERSRARRDETQRLVSIQDVVAIGVICLIIVAIGVLVNLLTGGKFLW